MAPYRAEVIRLDSLLVHFIVRTMSFFSWGSQHRSDNLPTGGSEDDYFSASPGRDKEEYDDTQQQSPLLAASSSPPTTLGYDTTTDHQQQHQQSPPSFHENQDTTVTTQNPIANDNIHVFVPQAAATTSPPPQPVQQDEDSWVETSPVVSETSGVNHHHMEESMSPVSTYERDYHSSTPGTTQMPQDDNLAQPGVIGTTTHTDSNEPQQQYGDPRQKYHSYPAVEENVHYKNDEWEEIDNNQHSNNYTSTGPATLETVGVEEPPARVTGEFEWIASSPSEDPTIIFETRDTVAVRSPNKSHSNSVPSTSSALVIPRGLPSFTKGVKTGLTQLQDKNSRRQHEVRTRIHAVECKMARWTANLATERMERQEALEHVMGDSVYQPAGILMERVSRARQQALNQINRIDDENENQSGTNEGNSDAQEEVDETTRRQPRWRAVETRLTALETQMAQSAHALAKDRRLKLLSLHDRLVYDILPRIYKDRAAAAAQENVLLERVDQLAGDWAARSRKECATRHVAIHMTDEYLQTTDLNYDERHHTLEQDLVVIRDELKREQEERQRQDEEIQQQMMAMAAALRAAMLEAVGDPQD